MTQTALTEEFGERLKALLAIHQCEPTAEGWRSLALALAREYEPAFQIETGQERAGKDGKAGRPAGRTFLLRSAMKAEMRRTGGTAKAAAEVVSKKFGVSVSHAQNVMSRKAVKPDFLAGAKEKWKVDRALKAAAEAITFKDVF